MRIPFTHHNTRLQRSISCFLLLFVVNGLFSQLAVEGLDVFNDRRIEHQQKAMLVLGGWALTNIGGGFIMANRKNGSDRYFHQMNAYWNIVNLGIAGIGYYTAFRASSITYDPYESAAAHFGFQRILLLNAGLDVGYILGGLYLTERSKRFMVDQVEKANRLKGFGQAIMLQGGFLLLFDIANHFISASYNDDLKLLFNGSKLGLSWSF